MILPPKKSWWNQNIKKIKHLWIDKYKVSPMDPTGKGGGVSDSTRWAQKTSYKYGWNRAPYKTALFKGGTGMK